MKYITIEQAVEVVRKCSRTMLLGQVEVVVSALRALQPAEPTEQEVERVARAIYAGYLAQNAERYENEGPVRRTNCENAARAAIAAMKQTSGKER